MTTKINKEEYIKTLEEQVKGLSSDEKETHFLEPSLGLILFFISCMILGGLVLNSYLDSWKRIGDFFTGFGVCMLFIISAKMIKLGKKK